MKSLSLSLLNFLLLLYGRAGMKYEITNIVSKHLLGTRLYLIEKNKAMLGLDDIRSWRQFSHVCVFINVHIFMYMCL